MVRAVLLAVSAIVVCMVAAAPAGAQPVASTVTKNVRVTAGEGKTTTVYCRRGSVAVGGSILQAPSGATPGATLPRGTRGWRFSFRSLEGSKRRTARVIVRCVRLALPAGTGSVRYRVGGVNRTYLVKSLSAGTVSLSCPRGFVPTDYGMEERDTEVQPGLPTPNAQLYAVIPGRNRMVFGLENLGAGDVRVRMHVRCLEARVTGRRSRGGRASHRFRVRRVVSNARIKRGRSLLTRSCPTGYSSLSAGFAFDPKDDITVGRRSIIGTRSGRVGFDNATGDRENVRTYLSCLNLRTRFSR